MRRYHLLLVALWATTLFAQDITTVEYYIDTDPGFGQAEQVSITPAAEIDVSFDAGLMGVSDGFHVLYVRALDEDGNWSLAYAKPFVKESAPLDDVVSAEYCFDVHPGPGSSTVVQFAPNGPIDESFIVDLSGLADGFHVLYVRVLSENGNWSLAYAKPFVKESAPLDNIVSAEYYFDADPGMGSATAAQFTPNSPIDESFIVDLSGLADGFHVLYVRVLSEDGNWSHAYAKPFVKEAEILPSDIVSVDFFLTGPGYTSSTLYYDNFQPASDIDVTFTASLADLGTGTTYKLNAFVTDENGTPSLTYVRDFSVSGIAVTNTNDSGSGSLRQAVLDANATPGSSVIQFNMPGDGPHSILPVSPLPAIAEPVVIDGYTQPGAAEATETETAVLMVELDGTNAGTQVNGLTIAASDCTIRGLAINRFDGEGIVITGATNNRIEGNYIGTDVTGTQDLGNALCGVMVIEASNNTIGGTSPGARNVISGNDDGGVGIGESGSSENVVQGNLIGTDVTGTAVLGNSLTGIFVANGATDNVIGGTESGAGNVISNNGAAGVVLGGPGTTGNVVAGNFIGTDIGGISALPNSTAGVWIVDAAANNTIGGTTSEARNIISGNDGSGITITVEAPGLFPKGNRIKGNFIGTDVTGTQDLGNSQSGVEIADAFDNRIGGTGPGARNVISGNEGSGVRISGSAATGNRIKGNFIGTDVSGTSPLGNRRAGLVIRSSASSNTVGGTGVTPGECDGPCNRIAFNGRAGVRILDGTGNAILGNSIVSNASLGIDLAAFGVTANDAGDGDTGANLLQNFPVLASATSGRSTTIEGDLSSTPNTAFRLQFFSNATGDASGYGEGQTFIGQTNVTTDGNGKTSFTTNIPVTVPSGQMITSTATDPDHNTSEFSNSVAIPFAQGICGQTLMQSVTLTEDFGPCEGGAILIGADGITINGNGHAILGDAVGSGVLVSDRVDVTIRHLRISGFETGIKIEGGTDNTIAECRIDGNRTGVSLSAGSRTLVMGNTLKENGVGISAQPSGSSIYHNILWENATQVRDAGHNQWVSLSGTTGNYWSDYFGLDDGSNGRVKGDFIGDTDLPHAGVDWYPLLDPSIIDRREQLLGHGEASLLDRAFAGIWDVAATGLNLLFPVQEAEAWWGKVTWLAWRGGWSPVDIQVTDPHGLIISADQNDFGRDGLYYEEEDLGTGSKRVHILLNAAPAYGDGAYTFQMTAGEDLTYWMDHLVSRLGDVALYQYVTDVPLSAGETRVLETRLEETVGPGGEIVLSARRTVEIDIKPGNSQNTINNDGHGVIPVAILGRADFDVTQIDVGTVSLEGLSVKATGKKGKLLAGTGDVNGDGIVDLEVKIEDSDGTIGVGAITAMLTGNLLAEHGGAGFQGTDEIRIVPPGSAKPAIPVEYALDQNHPNPYNPTTQIGYQLPEASDVTLVVYNALGQVIRTLVQEQQSPGTYTVSWDGRDGQGRAVASGVYLYRFTSKGLVQTNRMLLLK